MFALSGSLLRPFRSLEGALIASAPRRVVGSGRPVPPLPRPTAALWRACAPTDRLRLPSAGRISPAKAPAWRPPSPYRPRFKRQMMKHRLEDAGMPDLFSPHSFRVTVVSDLLNQNVPLEDVQYLAGHSSPTTTRVYDRRRRKVTRNIVERISN